VSAQEIISGVNPNSPAVTERHFAQSPKAHNRQTDILVQGISARWANSSVQRQSKLERQRGETIGH
jgi:hypothetical protein